MNLIVIRKFCLLFSATLLTLQLFCQNPEKPRLITGPVVGEVTKNSAKIWIAYKGNGQEMLSLSDTSDNGVIHATSFTKITSKKGITALTMTFTGLQPDHLYKARIIFDVVTPRPKCFIRTLPDTTFADYNFLVGSCALLNTDFSRFMFPGASSDIFISMKKQHSDFMVWLGDNVYYLGKQYTDYDKMFVRNIDVRRAFPTLREFLAAQPNYAIWDDHDYGWNDSDKRFPLKDSSLTIFKGFWPNPYHETATFKGNYFTYKYFDSEFFMTDDRWYRDIEGDTSAFLGKEQLVWLKAKLKESNATFKFICIGSQVLNDSYYGESYAKYPKERNDLLDFIATNNIKGVIFVTGDKHYTELSKREWKGYTFYDFTSSPLTSPIVNMRYLPNAKNKFSVPGTILYKKNFGKITITGPKGNRTCLLEILGRAGQRKWKYEIKEDELSKK